MEKLIGEAALRAIGKWFREDPDFVFQSTAANYTLSNLQMACILARVSEHEDNPTVLPHLVSCGYLQERQIDPGKCRSYRVPVPEQGEVRLFAADMPCGGAFTGKEAMTEILHSRMRRLDALARAAEKANYNS